MKWLVRTLFDWVFVLLFGLLQGFLNLVNFIESFFDIFAGTAKVFYKGNSEFLINIFFGHSAVTNAFWAMALIAIVLAFGFCIVQVSRKAMDVTGSVKQSIGQILSSFFRCMLIILLLNLVTVAVINITNVLLDRINFALKNASVLNQQETDRTFSDQEYAVMTRILATVANYSVNPSANSRYNVNSCFNAIRPDLLSLYVNGFFNYDYLPDANGHYTWQGALALLASSADLTTDLKLDATYDDVFNAFQTVSQELSTYRDFGPVEKAHFSAAGSVSTDVLIFLISGMKASQNPMYNNGSINDALRKGYVSGKKTYNNLKQVRKDFDIWKMDYLVGYISCSVFIIIMAICIFTFIVRIFNLLLLYLTAPLFASSMPMDDGGKWQSWTQAFVIQLFSGFGMVVAMRLYLIIIPIIISSDLVFFAGSGAGYAILNMMAQLLMVLGGAWAVLQAGDVITGILAGNPGMAAIHQEGRIGSMVTGWATRAPRAALGAAKDISKKVSEARGKKLTKANEREQLATRKSQRAQVRADMARNRADTMRERANDPTASRRVQNQANRAEMSALKSQQRADRAKQSAAGVYARYGGTQSPGSTAGLSGLGETSGTYRSLQTDHQERSELRRQQKAAMKARQSPDRPPVPPRATPVSAGGGSGSSGEPQGVGFSEIQVTRNRPASHTSETGGGTGGGTPPPPSGGGATAPRARAAASVASDTGASTSVPASGGGSGSFGGPQGVGFSEIQVTRNRPASHTSETGGGTGGGTPPPPSGGGATAPRARAAASTAVSASGGGTPPAPSGGGAAAPRARAAAPGAPESAGFSEIRVTRNNRPASQTPKTGSGTGGDSSSTPPRKR